LLRQDRAGLVSAAGGSITKIKGRQPYDTATYFMMTEISATVPDNGSIAAIRVE
jgi:hypothetical protein